MNDTRTHTHTPAREHTHTHTTVQNLGRSLHPSHGMAMPSPAPSPSAQEDILVRALERWRAAMGIERMVLCGHSLGAMLASAYAMAHPHRCIYFGCRRPPVPSDMLRRACFSPLAERLTNAVVHCHVLCVTLSNRQPPYFGHCTDCGADDSARRDVAMRPISVAQGRCCPIATWAASQVSMSFYIQFDPTQSPLLRVTLFHQDCSSWCSCLLLGLAGYRRAGRMTG